MIGWIVTTENEWGAGARVETEAGKVLGGWVYCECQERRYKIGNFPSVNQSLPGQYIR